MLNINKLAKRPKIFHTLCGLSPDEFTELLARVTPLAVAAEYKRRSWKGRKRAIGGGDRPKLSLEEQLFMLLMFYRTYAGQVFIGMVVGLDDSNVSRRIRRLEPVLAQVFRIPQKKIDLTNDELWELIVDATEQETQRRKGTGYSGKKGRQTIKTQIHINKRGIIKAVSQSIPGNRHDKHLYDVSHTYARGPDGTPQRVKKHGDLGYSGTECDLPFKKPKSRPLMMHEKYANRQQAKKRIEVEHTIAHMKQWRILADRFRNATNRHNLIFRNVAGLRNFIQASQT
jgi:DDE superfamily endonuclease/Helix-turn-helix of DDE superfamily endonuclease